MILNPKRKQKKNNRSRTQLETVFTLQVRIGESEQLLNENNEERKEKSKEDDI